MKRPSMMQLVLATLVFGFCTVPMAAQEGSVTQTATNGEPELTPRLRHLQVLSHKRLDLDFERMPARDVFDAMRDTLGINLVVRYADAANPSGIDPEMPITLKFSNVRALDALEMVIEQCADIEECTWQLRAGFVEVGTKSRLSVGQARVTRVYPIEDLLVDPPNFDDAPSFRLEDELFGGYMYDPYYGSGSDWYNPGNWSGNSHWRQGVYSGGAINTGYSPQRVSAQDKEERAGRIVEVIVTMVEPDVWQDNGGDAATITYVDGALVVRAPDFVHRQIGGYPQVPPPKEPAADKSQ